MEVNLYPVALDLFDDTSGFTAALNVERVAFTAVLG